MRGTGRIQSFSPTGNELYTLYTQQGPNYAHGGPIDDRPGLTYAFVHLLNLDGGWTHCIDLPMPFGTGPVTTHAFALSADGSRLYVADPSSGGVAVIDPVRMHVRNSTTLNLEPLTRGEASAAVASDGTVYLAGGSQILALDGETLRPIDRWRLGREVSGIAASSDGSHVYVGLGRRVGIIESKTGAVSGRIHMTDLERVLRLAAGVE
jgi:DNA-binding beta-propeller fold protein YncE